MFDSKTGEYEKTIEHQGNLGSPFADIQGLTQRCADQINQFIQRANSKIWNEIGNRRLSEEEKKDLNQLTRDALIKLVTDSPDQDISALLLSEKRSIGASWFRENFPEDITFLEKHGLNEYPTPVQNALIERMCRVRNGIPPVSYEYKNGQASIKVIYHVRSLTLLNSIFSKL